MATPLLAGLDVGTSAAKALVCTFEGRVVAEASASYPLQTPQPGYVEQDVETIAAAATQVLRDAVERARVWGGTVAAIGISTAMHGLIAVDAAGAPQGPLLNWMDRRAAPVAERWRQNGTAERLYARTGAPVHPMLPSCKLRWLSEREPQTFARAARFVGLKELLVHRWCGEWLIDWGIAGATGMFSVRERAWDTEALQAAGVQADRLSTPVPPSTSRPLLRSAANDLGLPESTPVVLASSDGALANLGSGAVAPTDVALTLGTSGAVRVVADEPALDARGRTFCYPFDDTRFLIGGPTSSAGAVVNRIFALFAPDVPATARFDAACALAAGVDAGARGLTVVPFLGGERAPYWRNDLRGALVGLDLAHGPAEVFRATFEGVVFALADVQVILAEQIGGAKRLLLSGGLTHAPLVCQLVADVFNLEATTSDHDEASAFGAALMAGLATGALAGLAEAAALSRAGKRYEPQPAVHGAIQEAYARYRAAVAATLPLYESGDETLAQGERTLTQEDLG